MLKKILYTLPILSTALLSAQMLITDNINEQNLAVHPSAVLELRSQNKGLLVPRVSITSPTDITTIQNPTMGQLIYDTNTKRLMNYSGPDNWVKNVELSDADGLIKKTVNDVKTSNPAAIDTSFPSQIPTFTLDSGTNGWTDLSTELVIKPKKDNNTVLINLEGMVQPNNTSSGVAFAYAIGIFVNDKLKIVRKFDREQSGACSWNKFELTGLFYNLPKNTDQTIKVYGRNLRRGSNVMNSITYGGSASGCNNLSTTNSQIMLAAQVTE